MTRINDLSRLPMTAVVFDTLAYAERLEAAGFTAEQAKGQAHALREIVDNQIATKQDIAALEGSVTTKLAGMSTKLAEMSTKLAEMSTKLAEFKTDLIKWHIGTMLAMTGLIVGLLKFLH